MIQPVQDELLSLHYKHHAKLPASYWRVVVGNTSKKKYRYQSESSQYFGVEYFFWESEISIPDAFHKIYF